MDIKNHFIETYNRNTWGSDESRSGPGSERSNPLVSSACNAVISCIKTYLNDKEVIRISDIPCGDFNWIDILFSEIFSKTNCKKIEYYAYDIVPELEVQFNKINHMPNIEYNFKILNATEELVIQSDIIFCKELFIHLSYKHINMCIKNFINSNSTYFICTTSKDIPNKDISYDCFGECRDISLNINPFNLPKSLIDLSPYILLKLDSISQEKEEEKEEEEKEVSNIYIKIV